MSTEFLFRRNKMARNCVGKHAKRIHAHHKKAKKRLLKLYHRVRTHRGCYKAGKFPTKLPRGAPKSKPTKPKHLNKKGAGIWHHITKAWNWLTGHAKKAAKHVATQAKIHGRALMEEAKKRASAHAATLVSRGKDWAKKQASAAMDKARQHAEGYIKKANDKVNSVANKVSSAVSGYTGAKGSGVFGDIAMGALSGFRLGTNAQRRRVK